MIQHDNYHETIKGIHDLDLNVRFNGHWAYKITVMIAEKSLFRPSTSKINEAKSKMKHPSDMPTPRFELRW